ncbi:hypothetical protein [Carnobacterium maltaromaticum]|uniref:hypothetical protein n=1 Tax=Carnobacterium maltaromaticum TaxID=2751 RepID=UPI0012FA8619|nr:hypothetical protein [Carnobacterium maltaromaticum]
MNRTNQSVIAGIEIITDPKGDFKKNLKEKGYKVQVIDSKNFVDSFPFKYLPMGNVSISTGIIQCTKFRFFTLEEFDESLVQGYIKLIKTETGLGIHVVDTYNNESKEEEETYIKSGYIKIGYPIKNISKRSVQI